ncbi:MAG: T9SS type A sorting domain-containing protein [Bacteroidales bacterium]|nr:T9SS type A sorting domain-containing protein [Bacteroidales bacterium]
MKIFMEAGVQWLTSNGLPANLLDFTYDDPGTQRQINALFYPSIPAKSAVGVSKSFIVDHLFAFYKLMYSMQPLLSPASIPGEPLPGPGVCLGQWIKPALEEVLETTIDQTDWENCFTPVYDGFLEEILELALNQTLLEPLPCTLIIAGLVRRLLDNECLDQLPESYSMENIQEIIRLSLNGFLRFNGEPDTFCEELSFKYDFAKEGSESNYIKNIKSDDFCDIVAQTFGGSPQVAVGFSSGRMAARLCALGAVDPNAKYGPGFSETRNAINYRQNLNWSLNDEVMDGNTTTEFIYENPDADLSVTVAFELITATVLPSPESIKIFPNPFASPLTLQNTTCIRQVILMNITGQVMRVMDVNQEENITLQTEGLQPGIYLLRLIANDGSVLTFKVSKM